MLKGNENYVFDKIFGKYYVRLSTIFSREYCFYRYFVSYRDDVYVSSFSLNLSITNITTFINNGSENKMKNVVQR